MDILEEIITEGEFLHRWLIVYGGKISSEIPQSENITIHRMDSYFAQSEAMIRQFFGDRSRQLHSWRSIEVASNERYQKTLDDIMAGEIEGSEDVMRSQKKNQIRRVEDTLHLLKELRIKQKFGSAANTNDQSNILWYKRSHIQFFIATVLAVASLAASILALR